MVMGAFFRSGRGAPVSVLILALTLPISEAFVPPSSLSLAFTKTASHGVATCRASRTSSPLSLRASSSPPPPPAKPAGGSKTLSKMELNDLNLQLWEAARNGETAEVEKLAKTGAQVNYYDPEMLQATALQWAATNGHADTVEKLIELGGSVFPTNQFGWTALHHAANWGYVDCVKALLKSGADPMAKSESGSTPIEAAIFKGFTPVIDAIRESSDSENAEYFKKMEDKKIEGFDGSQSGLTKRGEINFSVWQEAWGEQ